MHQFSRTRSYRLATAALSGIILMSGAASAQTIRIFEDTPSVEQLRSIMIPESHGGTSRSIVLQRPDAMPRTNAVQASMVQPMEPTAMMQAAQPVQSEVAPISPAPMHSAAMPARATPVAAKATPRSAPRDTVDEAGIVGFRINFALDSANLPNTAFAFIDRMAELLQQAPEVKLQVEGHTDALGTAEYNQGLSERRAAAVAEYLVDHCGIPAERLVVRGKGMNEPLTRDPYDGQNRRVQFVRIG
jgi:OOP family OmpA-OmpF porin